MQVCSAIARTSNSDASSAAVLMLDVAVRTTRIVSMHGLSADAGPSIAQNGVSQTADTLPAQNDTHLNGTAAAVFEWESSGHSLTHGDIERYSRQLILPALGVQGGQ
jgi:predicted protein tyrosine phosphatase